MSELALPPDPSQERGQIRKADLLCSDAAIPQRLDELPWSAWHLRVLLALGVTWLLDGLEGSLGGSLAGPLSQSHTQGGLGLTDAQLGLSSSLYLVGAVVGALLFGYMADRFGRRRLFLWTLVIYVSATAATAFSWNLASFTFCRMLTGAGIGGEYAAINSAVDELMPARLRGRVDLWINGTFWVGIILGSWVSSQLLVHDLITGVSGWRIAFCSGLPIAVVVWFARRVLPESPRWLIAHGDMEGAQASLAHIQAAVLQADLPDISKRACCAVIRPQQINLQVLWSARFRKRTFLCLALMIAQAFFYNSVFFSLSLVLLRFYSATNAQVSVCFTSIAIANVLGPFLLGTFFDSIGRRKMIAISYGFTGIFLTISSLLFLKGALGFRSQVAFWALAFFFASTAASSAYLTASEAFPQQIRASAIAIFYAFGTLLGGVSGPLVFGKIIGSGQRSALFAGYLFGAAGMFVAGCIAFKWGLDAERKSLEELAGA